MVVSNDPRTFRRQIIAVMVVLVFIFVTLFFVFKSPAPNANANHPEDDVAWQCTEPGLTETVWTIWEDETEVAMITQSTDALFTGAVFLDEPINRHEILPVGTSRTINYMMRFFPPGTPVTATEAEWQAAVDKYKEKHSKWVAEKPGSISVAIPADACPEPTPTPTPEPTPTSTGSVTPSPTPTPSVTPTPHTSSQSLTCQNGYWTFEHWYDGELIERDVRNKCTTEIVEEGM